MAMCVSAYTLNSSWKLSASVQLGVRRPCVSARCVQPEESSHREGKECTGLAATKWDSQILAKMAVAAFAAGVLVMTPTEDAMAAKSGGRVGGQAFRSSPPPRAAPRTDNSRSSRTNIYVNPPSIAPPIYGGYPGYGSPFFGGWSPFSYYTPGPSVVVGGGGGFGLFFFLVFIALSFGAVNLFRRRDNDDPYD